MIDGGGLADCIIGIYKGLADLSILQIYDKERRRVFHEFTNPVSSSNKERMHRDPQEVVKNDPFMQVLSRMLALYLANRFPLLKLCAQPC